MLSLLKQELTFGGHKQLISTIIFVVFGSFLLEWMPMGFTDTSIGIYRFLCAGYGVYAISNSIMLILLYFEDYTGALLGTLAFAAVSVAATVLQILFGSIKYFGLGFLLGGLIFYFIVWLRLEWYTRRLPYFLLCRQAIIANREKGVFARFCDYLEERDQKQREKEQARWQEIADRKKEKQEKSWQMQEDRKKEGPGQEEREYAEEGSQTNQNSR